MTNSIPRHLRMWNALIRVVSINGNKVTIIVPSWSVYKYPIVDINIFPEECRANLKEDDRFMGRVNTDAETSDQLIFEDLTIA